MGKRVLVVLDFEHPFSGGVSYGIQLAVRINASLCLAAVVPHAGNDNGQSSGSVQREEITMDQRKWINQILERCRLEEVRAEVYLSSMPLLDTISHFLRCQPETQFVVLSVPRDSPAELRVALSTGLDRISRMFGGKILLVRERMSPTALSALNL